MNILFLTLLEINSLRESGIYTDVLREFTKHGHTVYVVSPLERRCGRRSQRVDEERCHILRPRIGNIQKTNLIEKGISTLTMEPRVLRAVERELKDVRFDLILYSTPPITLTRVIGRLRRRDGARTYLLLKDIFPQNAVDLGMMRAGGPLHRYFRRRERRLYDISDRIGCMSKANADYVTEHNPGLPTEKVEVCPNSMEPMDVSVTAEERAAIRARYGLPLDRKVFVYGGNLGRPQGIGFLIRCLEAEKDNGALFFFIVGAGTEYGKLEAYIERAKPRNVKLMPSLPREDFDRMLTACDAGMIFLDHRFTIPNFPSRLLSYMQAGLPVLACTDAATDIGRVIEDGGFGCRCESDDVQGVKEAISRIMGMDAAEAGKNARRCLEEDYSAAKTYEIIMGAADRAE